MNVQRGLRVALIGAVFLIVIVLPFLLLWGTLPLISDPGADSIISAATPGGRGVGPATIETHVATNQLGASRNQPGAAATATSELASPTAEPSRTPRPPTATATAQPSATTTRTPSSVPARAQPSATIPSTTSPAADTAQPYPTLVPNQTPELSPTPATTATTAVAVSLHWPDLLPVGMAFDAENSWPFHTVAPGRENEPFLIFRDGPRWLLIRNQSGEGQPIPRSATKEELDVAGTPAMLFKYLGGGFKLVLTRDGQTVQISGQEVSDEDIRRTAASLRPLTVEALQARLIQEAAQRKLHVTLLWPNYLPDGVKLAREETISQIIEPAAGPQADGYRVTFRGPSSLVQVGGGTVEPPSFAGTQERINAGLLTGLLTVAQDRYALVIEAGAASGSAVLTFPDTPVGMSKPLPLVQQGRVFISAENIDRAEFDRVVASLITLRPQDFASRLRGQNPTGLTYLWPSMLPNGYSVDISTVQAPWDDFLLQGGAPFFQLTATAPGSGAISIKGGRERSGQTLVVPEGGDVQRTTTTIRGQVASAAQTPDGSLLLWSEYGSLYAIHSRSVPVEQLIAVGEGLRPVDADEFYRRIR